MNKNTIKKILIYVLIVPIISFSNVGSFEVSSYVDEVTGYDDSESVYSTIEQNGAFPNLMNDDVIDQEDVPIINNNEPVDDPLIKLQETLDKINYSMQEIDTAINKINDENKLKKFFVGGNFGVLSFQLVQIKNQTYSLGYLEKEIEDESTKIKIDSQIKYLDKEKIRVEKFILEQKNKLSLFGWFVGFL